MNTSYYIYYRVAASDSERLKQAVGQMQHALQAITGVSGRLLRRVDDAQTWMEIYENIADTTQFEAALAEATTAHGLKALLESPRVTERFVLAE